MKFYNLGHKTFETDFSTNTAKYLDVIELRQSAWKHHYLVLHNVSFHGLATNFGTNQDNGPIHISQFVFENEVGHVFFNKTVNNLRITIRYLIH